MSDYYLGYTMVKTTNLYLVLTFLMVDLTNLFKGVYSMNVTNMYGQIWKAALIEKKTRVN